MYIGTIINSLIIIIILHLLICNFKKHRSYETLKQSPDNVKNIINDIKGVPEYLLNKAELMYSSLTEDANNIIKKTPKKILLNQNIKNIDPSYSVNLSNYDNNFNHQSSLREINKTYDDNCVKSDINQHYEKDAQNNCFDKNIKTIYDNQELPEINEEIDIYNNKNINIPKNLMQSNNSCNYSTSEDIHMVNDGNLQPTEACAHNVTNTFENKKQIDEKPMHGGSIGNYVGFNNYDEYAPFKRLF